MSHATLLLWALVLYNIIINEEVDLEVDILLIVMLL